MYVKDVTAPALVYFKPWYSKIYNKITIFNRVHKARGWTPFIIRNVALLVDTSLCILIFSHTNIKLKLCGDLNFNYLDVNIVIVINLLSL